MLDNDRDDSNDESGEDDLIEISKEISTTIVVDPRLSLAEESKECSGDVEPVKRVHYTT